MRRTKILSHKTKYFRNMGNYTYSFAVAQARAFPHSNRMAKFFRSSDELLALLHLRDYDMKKNEKRR